MGLLLDGIEIQGGRYNGTAIREAWFNGVKIGTFLLAPVAPVNIKVFSCGSVVTVSWDSVSNATSYTVYYGTNSSNVNTTFASGITETNASAYLSGNTTYYFRVVASNNSGSGPSSNVVSITT